MARQRDYRAEYAARQARAQATGYRSYAAARVARAQGEALPGDTPGRRQIIPTGDGGRIVRATAGGKGAGVVEAQVRAAERNGERLALNVTTTDGRTVNLTGRGGMSARALRALYDEYGDWDAVFDHLADDEYGGGGAVTAVPGSWSVGIV